MVICLGNILFDHVAGRGLRCAVHSALCLGPHGLYDVLKVITPGPDTTERISNTASAISSGPPNLDASRAKFFEPSALSEAFRPPFGMPEGDGDTSGYHGRDRRLRPLRWEMGGMREYVTDKCCNRADRRLSNGATKTTTGNMVKKDIPQANNHSSTKRILKSVNW